MEQTLNTPPAAEKHTATAEALYRLHSPFLEKTLELFLLDTAHEDARIAFARKLKNNLGLWVEGRYSDLACLRLLSESLADRSDLLQYLDLPFELGFTLWLRDQRRLPPHDIAAAMQTSEGSVRTRLFKARLQSLEKLSSLYPAAALASEKTAAPQSAAAANAHYCIQDQEILENWEPELVSASEITMPARLKNIVKNCDKCASYAQSRALGALHARHVDNIWNDGQQNNAAQDAAAFPLSSLLVKKDQKLSLNWGAAPWYLKILFEGLLATSLVVGVVLAAPRIKSLYELWLERRFDLYSISELAANLGTELSTNIERPAEKTNEQQAAVAASPPPTLENTGDSGDNNNSQAQQQVQQEDAAKGPFTQKLAIQSETEFAGKESSLAAQSRVHRLFLKTDSPEALSAKVLAILAKVDHQAADPSLPPGSAIPGGVLFDVFVPVKEYISVINQVAQLGDYRFIITKSKERVVPGMARVRIWIQQI